MLANKNMNTNFMQPALIRGNIVLLVCCCVVPPPVLVAQERDLATGDVLRQILAQPIEAVSWKGKTLRQSLERVTETQTVCVMLDRRMDPDQEVEFNARLIPLGDMIDQLARQHGGSSCQVGSVVYVGPAQTCHLLPTVNELRRDEIRKLPLVHQRRLLKSTPWKWERLTTPKQLLEQLERDYNVSIAGKENMPHDLWPAMKLPALDFATKLSLVLAGFHVTFKVADDGRTTTITAMPSDVTLRRDYDAGSRAAELSRNLSPQFPEATFSVNGDKLVVEGPWEVHNEVERFLRGTPVRPAPSAGGKKHYTLTVENKPAGGVARAIGQHVGKKVVFDVKVDRRLTKEISINVKEVSLEQLLTAVLTPANLKFEIKGDTIRVFD